MMTQNKSIQLIDFLSMPVGTKAQVTTDNSLYGTTLSITPLGIVNERTGIPVQMSGDLLSSKMKVVDSHKYVLIEDAVTAYHEGKRIGIVVEGVETRFLKKNSLPDFLKKALKEANLEGMSEFVTPKGSFISHAHVVTGDEIITMDELHRGRFFIQEDSK